MWVVIKKIAPERFTRFDDLIKTNKQTNKQSIYIRYIDAKGNFSKYFLDICNMHAPVNVIQL